MSTKLNRQQVSVLIKETIENKLFEHKLTEEIDSIYESRQDLRSAMLVGMLEELSGKKIPDPTMLDEGIWEKAKGMLAKIRLSKSTGAAKQRDALEAAANKAANQKFSEMFSQLKQAPGFDKFPNNDSEEEFVGITTGLGIMYQSVVEAHKDGLIETDTANDLITNIKSYVDGLEGDLSYSYRYFNEEEDAAEDDDVLEEEGEVIQEKNINKFISYNKAKKVFDLMDTGKASPKQAKWLKNKYDKLEAEFQSRGGFDGMTRKEKDLLQTFRDEKGVFDSYTDKGAWEPKIDKKGWGDSKPDGGGGRGGGGGAEGPELGPEMDPGMEDEFGNYSDDGDRGFADSSPLNPMSQQKFSGVGDIGGVQDLGKLYRKAGSLSTLSGWLGPGFLKSVAGFALPVAAIGGIAALVGKRLLGKSREGSLKKLSGVVVPVDPSEQGTESPQDPQAPLGGEEDAQAPLGGGDDSQLPDAPDVQPDDGDDSGSDPEAGKIKAPDLDSDPMKGGPPPRGQAAGRPPEMISAPDLDSDREEDEDEKEARLASYQNMAEVKRWQKIAGIIKG